MKLLFDQNLSFKLCARLADLFSESEQVSRLGLQSADDRTIWQYASANGFTLVSQDADFADLAALYGPPPKVIWLRCGNQATETVARMLRDQAAAILDFERDAGTSCLEIF